MLAKTQNNGDAIIISTKEPYLHVEAILDYTDECEGEDEDVYFIKHFRWGTTGKTFSDWVVLSQENISSLLLDSSLPFWIEYKYQQFGEGELTFNSISLELQTQQGIICNVPQVSCDCSTGGALSNLIIDCCDSTWDPYSLGQSEIIYNKLSDTISNIFGFCAMYYKTEANQASRDVFLKEYSLLNVIGQNEIKILFPENKLPTKEIQFHQLQLDYPVTIEVHIVKKQFQDAFGKRSRPDVGDYLWFNSKKLRRMFEVDSVIEPDDFLYAHSYWRVILTPYQIKSHVDRTKANDIDTLIIGENLFNVENADEYKDITNEAQFKTQGLTSNDKNRRIIAKQLKIKEQELYNNWTTISKHHYDLSTINRGEPAIIYKNKIQSTQPAQMSLTFLSKVKSETVLFKALVPISVEHTINTRITFDRVINNVVTLSDFAVINNKCYKIITLGDTFIDVKLDTTIHNINTVTFKSLQTPVTLNDSPSSVFQKIHIDVQHVVVELNGDLYNFTLPKSILNKWVGIVLNFNVEARQISLFCYELREENVKQNSSLSKIYNETQVLNGLTYAQLEVSLLGSSVLLTNFRAWSKPIEEEEHIIILSQSVVKDVHINYINDNASPQLAMNRINNPR